MDKEDSKVKTPEEFGGLYLHEQLSKTGSARVYSNPDGYKETFKDHVLSAGLQKNGIINNGGNMDTEKKQNDGELNLDDLNYSMGGYGSNQLGVKINSQHAETFRQDTLKEHQQFWGIKPENIDQADAQQSRRFSEKAPEYDPQGRRIPDQEHMYDPLGRREVASHDRLFGSDDSHTHRR